MIFDKKNLQDINTNIDAILDQIEVFEKKYKPELEKVHENYKRSAKNLVHYLAFKSVDNAQFQKKLSTLGLPIATNNIEHNVLFNLITIKTIVSCLLNNEFNMSTKPVFNANETKNLLKKHTDSLYGNLESDRRTRILVTQPTEAADDESFAQKMVSVGMNSARINCAKDNEKIWLKTIENIKKADDNCSIMLDLAGPKLRTGKMKPGPKVIRIKPKKDKLGNKVKPAKIWLAPFGNFPPNNKKADAIIPVNKKWLKKTKSGSYIIFRDSRNKKCKIVIEEAAGNGRWGICEDSAYINPNTLLNVFVEDSKKAEIHSIQKILPLEEIIFLFKGDLLRIHKKPILGEPTKRNSDGSVAEVAHISCTLPEIFNHVKKEEPIYFDDGKIEGVITDVKTNFITVKITNTKKKGGKLKADKGINLPQSNLGVKGLTEKDKSDLSFINKHANIVSFSFVNDAADVSDLLNELESMNSNLGVLLKIETQNAFRNLPSILFEAMKHYPTGIMIARGDLAIETGWKNFAVIQEEIFKMCQAAHLPTTLATQVLENLAKKGIPTRAEITDAALAQRADCVMLNKGYYIDKAAKMLDKILRRMQRVEKQKTALPDYLQFKIK